MPQKKVEALGKRDKTPVKKEKSPVNNLKVAKSPNTRNLRIKMQSTENKTPKVIKPLQKTEDLALEAFAIGGWQAALIVDGAVQ